MDTIEEIRRQNLAACLIDSGMKDNEFAQSLDLSESYFGQLKTGKRAIGSKKARELELALKKQQGWFDHQHSQDDLSDTINDISIPSYTQSFSMGSGVLDINQDVEIKYFVTNRNWIAENLKHATAVKNICIITGEGNSMSPTIKDGAAVFLDLGVTSHIGDFVYAIKTQNDQLLIKQVNLLSTGEYCLISHNEFSPNETVETVSIIGKVIGAMNFDEL